MVAHSLEAIEQTGRRRRAHRPALARPRVDRLGHHRRQRPEDQRRADRRAGRAGHLVRRLAGRRDPAPALRLARPARPAGDRRRGVARASRRCWSAPRSPGPKRSSPASRRSAWEWGGADGHRRADARGARQRSEAVIQAWLVAVGQEIAVGDPLAEIETEKAVVEYAAEVDGILARLIAEPGATIAVGEPIAVVLAPGETDADIEPGRAAAAARSATPEAASPPSRASLNPSPRPTAGGSSPPRWCESWLRERGIDLVALTGTGPGGRIVRRDLDRLPVAGAATPRPNRSARPRRSPSHQTRAPVSPTSRSPACARPSPAGSPRARRRCRTSTSPPTAGSTSCSSCGAPSTRPPPSRCRSTTSCSRRSPAP